MMSLRRIFGLILLFFFFEAVVAVVTTFVWPNANVFFACVAMTALALGVWIVFMLAARLLSRPQASKSTQPKPAATPVQRPIAGDSGVAKELSSLMREANQRLATSVLLKGRREPPSTATLPLFLVIGEEASGKTNVLVNSGLEPRLLAGDATRDGMILPTRLCNLWFAEEALFADVSGRIVLQDADQWESALRVLGEQQYIPKWKRILLGRRAQPNLKGLILVCDMKMFMGGEAPQRINAFAKTLNDRLQTVCSVFRKDFPVYVIFSKCDTVQYFSEFFAHLSEPEARRTLGTTLSWLKAKKDPSDVQSDRESRRLSNYFNRIYMSLADKRMVLLAREVESKKRSLAYEFPREFRKGRSGLVQFLVDVFRPNPLQQGSRLRGFYFSGQRLVLHAPSVGEATISDFSPAPRRADATRFFGTNPSVRPGASKDSVAAVHSAIAKPLFLTEFFQNILLKDRAGNVAPRANVREQMYRNLAFGSVGALLLLLCVLWAFSWRNNRELLSEVQASVESVNRLSAQGGDPEGIVELESLRAPVARLNDYDRHGAPLSYRWGLYSGNDVAPVMNQLYFERFRNVFLDPMLGKFTTLFLSLKSTAPVQDDVYSSLKSYRMITSGACQPDSKFLNASLMPVWLPGGLNPAESELAERQMQFYVSELVVRNPYKQQVMENNAAVTQAQTYLHDLNGPDRIFRLLVDQVNQSTQGDNLSNYPANYDEVLNGPKSVDAVYSRAGWDAMMDRIHNNNLTSAGEVCVLGEGSRVSNLTLDAETKREVQDLYLKSYVQHWSSFLGAHHVVAFGSTADAARKLRVLADNNRSPLLGLVYMVSHNTDVASAPANSKVEQAVDQLTTSAKQGISGVLGRFGGKNAQQKVAAEISPQAGATPADVVREFEPVHVMVDPAKGDSWVNAKNQDYIKSLAELSNAMAAIPARPDPKVPADQQAIDSANKALETADAALHSLTGSFPNTPSEVDVDLKALLAEPIGSAERSLRHLPAPPPPPPTPPPPPQPPTPAELAVPVKAQVNKAAQTLCSSLDAIRTKFPFDTTASQEVTIQDLNDVFAPATGTLAQFAQSPDVSKAYVRQGRAWAANPAFPATFSQPFLVELNSMSEFADGMYADGGNKPHFDYTITLDGTGKVPFELDVDGHVIKYTPGKLSVPTKLVWPPITASPTKLILKTAKTGLTLPAQNSGPWSLFHLLRAADDQNGNLFTFRTIQFATSRVPLMDGKGNPVTVQIRVDTSAGNIYSRGYFSKLHCEGWAVH